MLLIKNLLGSIWENLLVLMFLRLQSLESQAESIMTEVGDSGGPWGGDEVDKI